MGTLLSHGRMCIRVEPGDEREEVAPRPRLVSLTALSSTVCGPVAASPVVATSEGGLLVMCCFGAFRTLWAV